MDGESNAAVVWVAAGMGGVIRFHCSVWAVGWPRGPRACGPRIQRYGGHGFGLLRGGGILPCLAVVYLCYHRDASFPHRRPRCHIHVKHRCGGI